MNEIRDILIGIDFGKEQSQINYYDRKADEPLSVSMKAGTSQFEFPTCICKRMERGNWCFGREAEYFAREHDGFLVDQLYDILCKKDSVQVGDEELTPAGLMEIFLEEVIKMLGVSDLAGHIKCLVITTEVLTGVLVKNLQEACEGLGFVKGQYLLQDYQESFYYYTMYQKAEYNRRKVAWYDFTADCVHYRCMSTSSMTKPALVTIGDDSETEISPDENLRDLEFYQFIERTMGNDIFSSVYITGAGFQREWAEKSVVLLCKQQRKVFYGTNLYARGACYAAREIMEEHRLKSCLYISGDMVRQNIGMDMQVMGSPAFHLLLEAGSNWYETEAECELILDQCDTLVFTVSNILTREKQKISMALPGLANRPNKTTRLKLHISYQSVTECRITVRDLGFGELFPSSGRVWTEQITWEE